MNNTLYTYLPQDRRRALAHGKNLPDRTTGAALFADISGFTPLTEMLRETLGLRRGAEELTIHLDAVYAALIAEVERCGGSVIGFAGDAITCWFDDDHGLAAPRAAACAFALQGAMKAFAEIVLPTGATIALALKVAVATGQVRRFAVGNPNIQLLDALAGATVDRMALGEHLAQQGDVLLDEATVNRLGAALIIREWRSDPDTQTRFAVAAALTGAVAAQTLSAPIPDATAVQSWVHRAVYEREQAGHGAFLTEFRPCVALFVRFLGIEYDADHAEAQLDAFVRRAQVIAQRHDGTLLQLTIGDKGSYAYLAFGALTVHEDDARRAAQTAIELRAAAQQFGFLAPLQIGVTKGIMRVGAYGGKTRLTYSALGDDVNLAARLMQAAVPGEILISGRVQYAVKSLLTCTPLPPLRVKGKTELVPVFAMREMSPRRAMRLQEPTYSLPMIGRRAELQTISEKLDMAVQGKCQILGITAAAGLGKSRLVAEVIRAARGKGFVGYGGACQADGVNTAYLAWKPIWNAFFEIDPTLPQRELTRRLEEAITLHAPHRLSALPLLRAIIDISAPLPDNDFTRALDAQTRQSALHALLEDCLKSAARATPILIVMEDLHWLDALSHDLLVELARTAAACAVCIVLAYRPPQIARLVAPRLEALPYFSTIPLTELSLEESEHVLRAKLAQLYPTCGVAPSALEKTILTRAQGNPFYLEELLNYLRDRRLDPSDPAALNDIELPDSLHTLILSRIDTLVEQQKMTLRVASIVGRLFHAAWLSGYYPALGTLPEVKRDLDDLDRLDITPLDTPEPELIYLFKHIVTHEVAYESLPFATRARLHEQLASYLETTYPNAPLLDMLAHHYGRSDNLPKKIEYLRKASKAARAAFANNAAMEYYAQLFPLLTAPAEQIELQLQWGAVLELTGQWEQAETRYRDALTLAHTSPESIEGAALIARCQLALGKLNRQRGDYAVALTWLEPAQASWTSLNDRAELSHVLIEIGLVYQRKGNYPVARQYLEESLTLTRALDDKPTMALAFNHLGTVAWNEGDYAASRALYTESLALRRAMGDKRGIASSLNNLGNMAYDQRDYAAAQALHAESLALKREMGDKWGIATSLNNMGSVALDQGDYAATRALYAESLSLKREIGDKRGIAMSLNNLGSVAYLQDDFAAARALYAESLALCQEIDARRQMAYALLGLGLVGLAQQSLDAREHIAHSLRLRQEMGAKLQQTASLVGMAGLALHNNDARHTAQLLGAVAPALQSLTAPVDIEIRRFHAQTLAAARAALGEKAFDTAWTEGAALTLEDAAAYALEQQTSIKER